MRPLPHWLRHPATTLGLVLIWIYRHCFSPFIPPCCRFAPSCSAYAETAVRRFGLLRGGWLSLWRLLRCHPFYQGPLIDPVPEEWRANPFRSSRERLPDRARARAPSETWRPAGRL